MAFDCTKPLGDKLELYLSKDINVICNEFNQNGIVFESQFDSLISMVCKHNSLEMVKLFSRECGLQISYGYDKETCNFFYYDETKYTMNEAINASIIYQKSQGN